MKKYFSLIGLLFLSACASTGPKFENVAAKAPANKALIYVYRPSHFGGAARSPDVYANDIKLGTIHNGGYFRAETAPGPTRIQFGGAFGDKSSGIQVDLRAGQIYFFRVDFSVANLDQHTKPNGTTTGDNCESSGGIPAFKLLTSNEEIAKLVGGMDTRVYKDICVLGMMFVSKGFALPELKETRL
jgi:hypothetical protein